jgi:hypothetical protein
MGLAPEGKEELTYNLGVLEGLHQVLNEEDTNPIYIRSTQTKLPPRRSGSSRRRGGGNSTSLSK